MAPGSPESPERGLRVVDFDLRDVVARDSRNDGRCGAVVARHADVVAAVEVRSPQGEEQSALVNRARIRAHALKGAVLAVKGALHAGRRVRQVRDHRAPPLASSARLAIP